MLSCLILLCSLLAVILPGCMHCQLWQSDNTHIIGHSCDCLGIYWTALCWSFAVFCISVYVLGSESFWVGSVPTLEACVEGFFGWPLLLRLVFAVIGYWWKKYYFELAKTTSTALQLFFYKEICLRLRPCHNWNNVLAAMECSYQWKTAPVNYVAKRRYGEKGVTVSFSNRLGRILQ